MTGELGRGATHCGSCKHVTGCHGNDQERPPEGQRGRYDVALKCKEF